MLVLDVSTYLLCNEKYPDNIKKPKERPSGTKNTLRDPEVGTEGTGKTLRSALRVLRDREDTFN